MQDFEEFQNRLIADRKVLALAQTGSYDTASAWIGSRPSIITFELELPAALIETKSAVQVQRFPYAKLEAWCDWNIACVQAPLAALAESRIVHDPTGYYERIQHMLRALNSEQLASYRKSLLGQAEERLKAASQATPAYSTSMQLLTLANVRQIAVNLLYPALLTHIHSWPSFDIRLPYAWRAAGLRFPKAAHSLDILYGFGGEDEARRVLLATRGLDLVKQEKEARLAFQAGYYDGTVYFLRDDAARIHRTDLENWNYLTSARRDKLSILIGVTRSPLGPAALAIAEQIVRNTREGF